jgi:hypothetical protein
MQQDLSLKPGRLVARGMGMQELTQEKSLFA